MSGVKKFGTFAGVFVPSILTILGVIMYMRLGWVVGHAGLWGAIIIILIAHVISITTGLSISSIATNKKVGAGGVYYVLSRSLGLPIGGAIGLTLFVGTALSIALYLVGFSESLNAYFELGTSVSTIRITGSLALLVLTALALISTSVALKSQFFIMAAIGVSLVAIAFGSWELAPVSVSLFGGEGGVSMETVFAIFFPAVTGFTAGIAMSGDLRDPKKSIPTGTIAAIAVGLAVYIGLAIFLAYAVNPETLRDDYNILMKIALWAPAVVAGIWGATLSSALGGILGGPRILQAMSLDKITPRAFGIGVGKSNEPRNALLLTVAIAECGILLGELDLIARVVSMFYLAAYGFINLSFFLESWASSDFTPSFKVKRWVGLAGFIATFAVMFKLDMLAMFAAFAIIGGIYLYLTRKQIALGSGDIWHSVWSSVVRAGLRKMDQKEDHHRNWKPNILLFSGGNEARPHLVEFSRAIAGKVGMVSNFDLIENPDAKVLFPKHQQSVRESADAEQGIFSRRQEVQNVFKGIEAIAGTYGFSGVEPNTVVMGWPRNTEDPLWFAQMTQKLIDLDYNVLYLDYDKRFGFRRQKQIDIWWRGMGNNSVLMLNVVKFLLTAPEWREAEVRVFMVNNSLKEGHERKIRQVLDEHRVNATVTVFANAVEQRPFYEIMKATSIEADLVMAGIPIVAEGEEGEFVARTNEMLDILPTVLLVKASSRMGGALAGDAPDPSNTESVKLLELTEWESNRPALHLPENAIVATAVQELANELDRLAKDHTQTYLTSLHHNYQVWVTEAETCLRNTSTTLAAQAHHSTRGVRSAQLLALETVRAQTAEFVAEDLPYLASRLEELGESWLKAGQALAARQPKTLVWKLSETELLPSPTDSKRAARTKARKRFWKKLGITPRITIEFQTLVQYYVQTELVDTFASLQLKIGLAGHELAFGMRHAVDEAVQQLGNKKTAHPEAAFEAVQKLVNDQHLYFGGYLQAAGAHVAARVSRDVSKPDLPNLLRDRKNRKLRTDEQIKRINNWPEYWQRNQRIFHRQVAFEWSLQEITLHLKRAQREITDSLSRQVFEKGTGAIAAARTRVEWVEQAIQAGQFEYNGKPPLDWDTGMIGDGLTVGTSLATVRQLIEALPADLEVLEEHSRGAFAQVQDDQVDVVSVDTQRIAGYLVELYVQQPLDKLLGSIPQEVRQTLSKGYQLSRLLAFSLNTTEAATETEQDSETQEEVFEKLRLGLKELEKVFAAFQKAQVERLVDIFTVGASHLTSTTIVGQAEQIEQNLARQIRVSGIRKRVGNLLQKGGVALERYTKIVATKRDDLLYADFKQRTRGLSSIHERIRNVCDQVMPNRADLEKVPFYYRQLFIGRTTVSKDFLAFREREADLIAKAITRQRSGASGAIMLLGEPLAGKSLFASVMAREHATGKVLVVEPPTRGSVDPAHLYRELQRQTGSEQDKEMVLDALADGTVVVFNDVELWWERSAGGSGVIRAFEAIIDRHGVRLLLLFNCNAFTYRLLRQQHSFQNRFLAVVSLAQFGTAQLQETLLGRHQAGGLPFSWDGEAEETLSKRKMTRLLGRFHQLSGGNVGAAFHLWLAHVKMDGTDRLTVRQPKSVELPRIADSTWLVLLAQIVLHKTLTPERIARIFHHPNTAEARELLDNLNRAGLIEETLAGTWRIQPYVMAMVVRELRTKEMI